MTAQFSEQLHYRGEELSLCSEPLGYYLKTVRQDFELEAPSTALWRGYVGTWTIEKKHLPKDAAFQSESIIYSSTYRVNQSTLVIERQFVAQRDKTICGPKDDQEWNRFMYSLKRDLRQQVFLE